jgi:uncharacterized protein
MVRHAPALVIAARVSSTPSGYMTNFARLYQYLESEDAPETCMSLSEIDGFLTGLLCSPEVIMPSEWLPVIWGAGKHGGSKKTLAWATRTIFGRYRQIASGLNAFPPHLQPVFAPAEGAAPTAVGWCKGFMLAQNLRRNAWQDLTETEEGRELMYPIWVHLDEGEGRAFVSAFAETIGEIREIASQQLPEVVPKIFSYWQTRQIMKALQQDI